MERNFPEIPLTKEEYNLADEESIRILSELKKKYCNYSISHLDIILNSLCFALARFSTLQVAKMDDENICKLIAKCVYSKIKQNRMINDE